MTVDEAEPFHTFVFKESIDFKKRIKEGYILESHFGEYAVCNVLSITRSEICVSMKEVRFHIAFERVFFWKATDLNTTLVKSASEKSQPLI